MCTVFVFVEKTVHIFVRNLAKFCEAAVCLPVHSVSPNIEQIVVKYEPAASNLMFVLKLTKV